MIRFPLCRASVHPLPSSARATYIEQCLNMLLALGQRLSLARGGVIVDSGEYAPRVQIPYGNMILTAERVTTKRWPGGTLNETLVTMRTASKVHSVNVEALASGPSFHSTVRRFRAALNLPPPKSRRKRSTRRYRFDANRSK